MRISTRTRSGRAGFTLVELLVAAALSILIMAVLSTAFQTGLQTLSTLKSLGDMAERLKTAETLLRTDLTAEHFAPTGNSFPTNGDDSPGIQRVSDIRFDRLTALGSETSLPPGGYFRIRQGNPLVAPPAPVGPLFGTEGFDADGLSSSSADASPNQLALLSFTTRRRQRGTEDLFAANLGTPPLAPDIQSIMDQRITDVMPIPGLYVTNFAQIDWFLDASRPTVLNGVTTWPLVRRNRVLGQNGVPITAASKPLIEDVVSLVPTAPALPTTLNTPNAIRFPGNRPLPTSIPNTSSRVGDDIVITNVLSFEVKATWMPGPAVAAPRAFIAPGVPNGDYPFDDLPLPAGTPDNPTIGFRTFDTMTNQGTTPNTPGFEWNAPGNVNSIPLRIRVLAVQVKIRVYDPKNKLTRQTTLVVKL